MEERPIVGLTLGDPAGIGPEITLKALGEPDLYQVARPLVIGDRAVVARALPLAGRAVRLHVVARPAEARFEFGTVDVLDVPRPDLAGLQYGVVQAEAGRAAFAWLERAIQLALAGEIEAIATAPLNKEALRAGGVPFLDHTEALAALTGSSGVMTMFTLGRLRIFFATRHLSLRAAIAALNADLICRTLVQARAALARFGEPNPKIAVAALNPHAGEHGLFGDEEIVHLRPGVEAARARGVDAYGPIPADAVFHQCRQGRWDAVLSLNHDQGHIAAKTVDFERTIAVTTGLPFVRASVDHGTAFDIAGRGIASAVGMAESVRVAARYALLLRQHGRA